jgi:ribosomal protein S18 acetylase RimI-like enzyme
MQTVTIRRATAEDAAPLTAVLDAAYAPYRALPGLPDVTAGLADDIAQHDVWVAEQAGLVLGGVVLSCSGETAHLVNLGVGPEAKGLGLGRQLLETAIAAARAAGARRLVLGTHRDMTGTRAFYRHLGWVETEADGMKVTLERQL